MTYTVFSWINYPPLLKVLFLENTLILMSLIFSFFILLFFLNLKTISRELKVDKKTLGILLLIFLVGFYLRNAEYHYGIHADGYLYAESAKYIVEKDIFVRGCAVGNLTSCRLYEAVLWGPGYPYLISLLYLSFGMKSILASQLSAILSSLTIIVLYFIAYLLFRNKQIGLYSALIFALIPLDLFFANTGNVRPTALFFISLTILFYLIALRKNTIKSWSLMGISWSFCIYVCRYGSILLPAFILGYFLFKLNDKNKASDSPKFSFKRLKIFLIPVIIFLISQIPLQYWILSQNSVVFGAATPFSFETFKIMSPIIIKDMFFPTHFTAHVTSVQLFNPLISICFFISLIFILKKNFRKQIIFLWTLFLTFFIIHSAFFQCFGFPENFCGDYVRHIQDFNIFYALLAGITIFQIGNKLGLMKEFFIPIVFILIFLTSNISVPTTIFKNAVLDETEPSASYFKAVNMTQNDCLIITSNNLVVTNDIFKDNGRKAIQSTIITAERGEPAIDEIKDNDCVLYFEDFSCKNYYDENCKFIYEKLNLTYLYSVDRIKIYNVTLKT